MGRAAAITAIAVAAVAAVVGLLAFTQFGAVLTATETDCPGDGCVDIAWELQWSLFGQSSEREQAQPEPASERVTRTWATLEDDGGKGAAAGRLAGTLAIAAVVAAGVGAALAATGMFLHRVPGIVGGAIILVGAVLALAAMAQGWSAAGDAGDAFVQELEARNAPDALNRDWAYDGPTWMAGGAFTLLAVAATLALVAGVIGVLPATYRKDV